MGDRLVPATVGGAAGLVAGVLPALLIGIQGRLDGSAPLQLDPARPGWLTYLAVASLGGAVYATALGLRQRGLAATVGTGLLFGLLWWIAAWFTVAPLATTGPRWSVSQAAASFALLVAGVLFGVLLALGLRAAASRSWVRRPAETMSGPARPRVSHRIVVLGGGFAGVATAQRLERLLAHRPEISVTLVSELNFLLFTPMLAEVASSSLVPRHVAVPLRAACPRTTIRRATVEGIDPDAKTVRVRVAPDAAAEVLAYDELVIALGTVPAFHGLPGVAQHAFTLKTLADATRLRDHVIRVMDLAEAEPDRDTRRELLTFLVAGGGFAGAELIAELADLVRSILVYYPGLAAEEPRFVLVHSRSRILPELSETLGAYALVRLRQRGIEFILGVRVTGATETQVTLSDGQSVPTRTFAWTAGNEVSDLIRRLVARPDGSVGSLRTDGSLRAGGFEHIWAVGDCAQIPDPDDSDQFCPPTAQHALRQGQTAAENIVAAIDDRPTRPFRFRTLGMLVVLGHNTAAAEIRGLRFSGLLAWFMWRGIYLAKLPGFEKKVRVLIDWSLDLLFPRDIVVVGEQAVEREAAPSGSGVRA